MAEIDLDPRVDEDVFVKGHSGRFKITAVEPCIDNHRLERPRFWVDLVKIATNFRLLHIPASELLFDEERPVYRAIEGMKKNGTLRFPDYVLDNYQVEAKEDHEGNPAFFVRFFVKPDDRPSPDKIKDLNRFLGSVETMLLSLSLNRWPYVQVSENRRLLDVAS